MSACNTEGFIHHNDRVLSCTHLDHSHKVPCNSQLKKGSTKDDRRDMENSPKLESDAHSL